MKCFLIFFTLIFPMILGAQQEDCNCCSEEQTAFDFWVGEWEVTDAMGNLAGYNRITKEQSGCVLKEEWTNAKSGYTGTSMNFFNKKSKNWEQLWIDNTGSILKLKGGFYGNQMVLESDKILDTKGNYIINRVTWTYNSDGTVRQLWEVIDDKKKSSVAFDGLYKLKKM